MIHGDAHSCADVLAADPSRGALSPFWRHPLAGSAAGKVSSEPVQVSVMTTGSNIIIIGVSVSD